jgi:hypothetical protein
VAKTADVQIGVWADPWFVPLAPDAKLLFLWAISCPHANMAGLYVVAEDTIRHETKLTGPRFEKALEALAPTMRYFPETGTVCIVSRPKHARVKSGQMAKSIAVAVKDCAHPELQAEYLERYGENAWLRDALANLALEVDLSELRQSSPNLSEVPSQSQVVGEQKTPKDRSSKAPDPDSLPEDFDPRLADAARRCLPVLQRTAEARGAKPVGLLAVSRAIETYPHKDHHVVAGELEHWLIHGNGTRASARDIVSRFRRFLDNSPDQLRPAARAKAGRIGDPALAKIASRPA